MTLAPQEYTSKQTLDTQRALVAQLDAQVKMDQATIDLATANLDYTTIRSPLGGRAGIRLIDAGNNVLTAANTSLVVITQMHPISVIFTLPDEDLPDFLKAAAKGPLTVLALSRDLKTELDRGTVAVLDNQILQATGTIRLKATFPNAKGNLWPGQFVNARLLVDTLHDVLAIPSPAVQRGPNGLYAYVVKSDSTVAIQPLKLDRFDGGQAVIESGLQAGERVVTGGQYRLQQGARVQSSNSNVASGQTAAPGGTPEHFGALYPATDRDLIVDGGDSSRRCSCLSTPSGSAVAASRLSDNSGHSTAAWSESRNDGVRSDAASGTAIRTDTRRDADDVEQHARQQRDHDTVRSRAQHRRRGAGRPDRD